jgi:hypothetical protein
MKNSLLVTSVPALIMKWIFPARVYFQVELLMRRASDYAIQIHRSGAVLPRCDENLAGCRRTEAIW